MKILVPIDGSSYSDNSLEFVASRATLLGKNPEIELLVVLAPLPTRAARLVSKDSLMRYYEDEAEKIFKPARKYLKAQGIEVTEAFIVGDPAEKIAEEVTEGGHPFRRKAIFCFMIRYLCPIFAAIILISSVASAFGWISI